MHSTRSHTKKSWHLKRRTFLRGLGVSVALPWLECMSGSSSLRAATGAGKRSVPRMCFNYFHYGVPMPPDDHPDRLKFGWFPVGEGRDYQLAGSHQSMLPFREKMTYFSGLSHPNGRRVAGHKAGDVFLTGASINGGYDQTVSVDQVAAQALGDQTRYPSLVFSSAGGVHRPYRSHTLSYDQDGRPIPSEHRPREIFNRLFGVEDAVSEKRKRTRLKNDSSILDVIHKEAASLNRRLGKQDQRKMDEYLTSVRQVEKQVDRAQDWLNVAKPHVDPKSVNLEADLSDAKAFLRSKYDLMALAFQTDSTRVATYQTGAETEFGPETKFPQAIGLNKSSHAISHQRTDYEQWSKYSQFLMEQHAYFLNKLDSMQEGDGTLLDNTMVLYGCCTSVTHVARNYPLILAGGGNLGIKHGRYLKFDDKTPLSNLFVTMLDRMNVPVKSFKDSRGEMSEITRI